MEYKVFAVAVDLTLLHLGVPERSAGLFSQVRQEVVSTDDPIFSECRTISDVEIAYERFWNYRNDQDTVHHPKEKVKVLAVQRIFVES